jgi:hypothetical protein
LIFEVWCLKDLFELGKMVVAEVMKQIVAIVRYYRSYKAV